MNTRTVVETVRMMSDRVKPLAAQHSGHPTHDWIGQSFEAIAGRTSALAALAETKAIVDDPSVVLRAAERLGEKVTTVQAEVPQRQANFAILWRNGVGQNWALPEGSEELRSVLRAMDAGKRLQTVTEALKDISDSESQKILGAVLPFGLHALTTGLDARQLDELREAFIAEKLPAYIKSRDDAEELFSNLTALLNFAAGVAKNFSNPGALRQLENDRQARLQAEARLASNE